MEEVPQDFERLVPYKENNSLYNVQLVQCRDPLIFGQLALFKKQLAEFLIILSRHKDDPTVSVCMKLENRADAAQASVTRAKAALDNESPNLIQLKCLSEEISELNKFYTEQSNYIKWETPSFVLSAEEMTDLREKLLTKIDVAQAVKNQRDDEYKVLNRSFLESKSLPKITSKSWPKFLRIWHAESHNFRSKESRINALKNSVTSDLDKQLIDNAQTEEKIFEFLYLKYGTRLVVSEKMLNELESCKAPTTESLEGFLINLIVVCEFLEREKQTVLVTPEKLSKVVNNCFDVSLCLEWAKILLKLKNDSKLAFESTADGLNFEESWQTKFGAQILLEFKNWCKQTIALHRTVKLPGRSPASQGGARPSSNPVKTTSTSIPQRWNSVRRLKMCQVCTSAADHGQFGQNCHCLLYTSDAADE